MAANNRPALVAGLAVLAAMSAAQNPPKPSGFGSRASSSASLLFRSFTSSRNVAVEAIIQRRLGDHDPKQFKLQQSGSGVSKLTVLKPICEQGIENFDDGRFWKTYFPAERKIEISASPNSSAFMSERQSLAIRNYRFASRDGGQVAGRQAIIIFAVPRYDEMPKRRYTLDAQYHFPLRIETEYEGERVVSLETVTISFPRSVSIGDPEKETVQFVLRKENTTPVSWNEPRVVQDVVGFKPVVPSALPFGFEVLDRQLAGEKSKFIAIRISDGLASATIYQFGQRQTSGRRGGDDDIRRAEAKGVRFRLAGDLPDPVIQRILDVFVREALKGLMPLLGTDFAPELLSHRQDFIWPPLPVE